MRGYRNNYGKWFPTATAALEWLKGEMYVQDPALVLATLESGEPVTVVYGFTEETLYPEA